MNWFYRPFKVITDQCTYWVMKEYYPKVDGSPTWSENAEYPSGGTKKELIENIQMMLDDAKKMKSKTEDLRTKK